MADTLGLVRGLLLFAVQGRGPLQPSPSMDPEKLKRQLQMRETKETPSVSKQKPQHLVDGLRALGAADGGN